MTNFGKIKEMTKVELAKFIANADADFMDKICEEFCEKSGCEWKEIAKKADVEEREFFLDICAKVCDSEVDKLVWWLSQDEDTANRSQG